MKKSNFSYNNNLYFRFKWNLYSIESSFFSRRIPCFIIRFRTPFLLFLHLCCMLFCHLRNWFAHPSPTAVWIILMTTNRSFCWSLFVSLEQLFEGSLMCLIQIKGTREAKMSHTNKEITLSSSSSLLKAWLSRLPKPLPFARLDSIIQVIHRNRLLIEFEQRVKFSFEGDDESIQERCMTCLSFLSYSCHSRKWIEFAHLCYARMFE
jgi:hypothetical protein